MWMNFKEIMLSKKANLKRIHTARFHLLSIPEKKKIIELYYDIIVLGIGGGWV